MKKFKAESQRVLDLMINSIYTHKEIFLRELISNASDAIDKLYYKSLTENLGLSKGDFAVTIEADKEKRILKVSDNGVGMTKEAMEENLGVIAKSGSMDFKKELDAKEDVNIIGQFGVGFYSAFMVSEKVEVLSRAYGEEKASRFTSQGAEGYTISEAEKDSYGTTVTMYLKPDAEDERYGEFLEEYKIKELVRKYSNFIRYPIKMNIEKDRQIGEGKDAKYETYFELDTLNSMIPIWKRNKNEVAKEEYADFYKNTFMLFDEPLKVITASAEGAVNYTAMLFVPTKAPYNYYAKSYDKGLALYTNGVMITEKCKELVPDCFSFIKGVVESELSLNISRETIQHNGQLKKIAATLEKKIKNELKDMLENDRENYEKFYAEFGLQLKYGVYDNWGIHKELLQDLLIFPSVNEDKQISFKEYCDKKKEGQKFIYYATGKSADAVKVSPQAERITEAGYDILCFTHDVDEFAIKFINTYDGLEFKSISAEDSVSEKAEESDGDKKLLDFIKETLDGKVAKVKLSARLKNHPVCLTAEGDLSIEMEKVMSTMPGGSAGLTAEKVLEINSAHPIYQKLIFLFDNDKEKLKTYAEVLYQQARLLEGLSIDGIGAVEFVQKLCSLLV